MQKLPRHKGIAGLAWKAVRGGWLYFQPGWHDRGMCEGEAEGQRQWERTACAAVKVWLEKVFVSHGNKWQVASHAGDRPSSCTAVPRLLL